MWYPVRYGIGLKLRVMPLDSYRTGITFATDRNTVYRIFEVLLMPIFAHVKENSTYEC